MYGLLDGEKMPVAQMREAKELAGELLALGNDATLDYIDGTGGNVRIHYRDARRIAIALQNAIQTINVLEGELAEAKKKETEALKRLGEQTLETR